MQSQDDLILLRHENEQLRASLETSLEENRRLTDDRDRLLRRVADLARELHRLHASRAQPQAVDTAADAGSEERGRTEKEMRVAFETPQALTEELEIANQMLHKTNENLATRLAERTRDLHLLHQSLQISEARFRTLVEDMPQLVFRATDTGHWTWSSPQWAEFTGVSLEDSNGWGWITALHPDEHEKALAAWQRARKSEVLELQVRLFHASEQRYRHYRFRACPVHDELGRESEWLGTATDVDDLIQLQQQQDLLIRELQHRTGNLMAVVQAILLRTIHESSSLPIFERAIVGRFQSLARVQGLLSRQRSGAPLVFDVLLREELQSLIDLDERGAGRQVSTSGPKGVKLSTGVVQTLALALHELMTNAIKHGALATPEGHLDIRWDIMRQDQRDRQLSILWRETGVADVERKAAVSAGGFGRELIERALPNQLGAQTDYKFEQDGVSCRIEIAIPQEIA